MTLVVFPLIVCGDGASGYRGRFPDLAEVAVEASDAAALPARAREALLAGLRRLEAAGEAWPTPTSLDTLQGQGPLVLLIDVQVEDAPVRVNISIGERLLARLDATAGRHGMTRSGFIATAVRRRLDEEAPLRRMVDEETVERLQREVAAVGRRVNETLGPDSEVGRTLADLDAAALDGLRRLSRNLSSAFGRPRRGPETEHAAPAPEQPAAPPA